MDRVRGKVAIVTGAAGGLGRAQALLLAKEGAKVVLTDIDQAAGKKVVEEIQSLGGEAIFIRHDVTSESDWMKVMTETKERFGRLDVLVNNAGVFLAKAIEEMTLEEWRRVMAVNVDGVLLGTKHAIKLMKKNEGGSIINLSSAGGLVGTVDTSAYNTSKGAVRMFTKAAALECSKAGHDYNIRVNSIHPGVIESPLAESILGDEDSKRTALSWHPIGHFGDPGDVAYGVLYLASDESKFLTGAELVIDGGWTAH
jgi:NAD(P)-dependent dehydrogenase (short-subunit alcohol dehydrogenase family)